MFAVSAGVNNFTIRIIREPGDGELYGWWGELAAVFSPFGPTGGDILGDGQQPKCRKRRGWTS